MSHLCVRYKVDIFSWSPNIYVFKYPSFSLTILLFELVLLTLLQGGPETFQTWNHPFSLAVCADLIWPVLVPHVVARWGEAGLKRSVVASQLVLQLLFPLSLHQLVEIEGSLSVLHWTVTFPPSLSRKTDGTMSAHCVPSLIFLSTQTTLFSRTWLAKLFYIKQNKPDSNKILYFSYLYLPVQQHVGQGFKGITPFLREAHQSVEEACTRVSDQVNRVVRGQHLKVIIDGVTHDHFVFKYTEDLQESKWTKKKINSLAVN